MSDNARHRIKLVLFVAIIGLFTFFGYHDGKRNADRWWQAQPNMNVWKYDYVLKGFSIRGDCMNSDPAKKMLIVENYIEGAERPGEPCVIRFQSSVPLQAGEGSKIMYNYYASPAPAGIGKPQAPDPYDLVCYGVNGAVVDCNIPGHVASRKHVPKAHPLKRPPMSEEDKYWSLSLSQRRDKCKSDGGDWSDNNDGTCIINLPAHPLKLGKRKPAPQQGGCTPEMGPGCAFIDNSSQGYAVPGCSMDHACVVLTPAVPTPQVS